MIHTSRQLKALVRNKLHGDNAKATTLIRNFVMERFIEKEKIELKDVTDDDEFMMAKFCRGFYKVGK